MDYSLPGSSVHGVLQVRILEWVAISFETLHRKWIKRQSFTQLKDIAHHVERTNEQEIKKYETDIFKGQKLKLITS